ncbi:MAG TPA: CoA transferase [Candidatus Bathyarchaeia archaeon]|nr:CoA transferase [Candidatus Bathyarchaeia archaeon]
MPPGPGQLAPYLSGVRVVEIADEQAEYCGRLLAGLGAEVIKLEPPGGSPTRRIGPFLADSPDPERSLFFWQYNLGKRSVVLDLDSPRDGPRLVQLLASADVLLESTPRNYLTRLGVGREALRERLPALVVARMSPFGDVGPWADWKGSDIVHLALGGPMMNTGYDPEPGGHYDLPPIAPQMWHAYHIAGEQLAIAILAALLYRRQTGEGQILSCAVHDAVAKNTELDLMSWIFRRAPFFRQTCRHAGESISSASIGPTKDGRWMMGSPPMGTKTGIRSLVDFLARHGMAADLGDERYAAVGGVPTMGSRDPELGVHVQEVIQRLFRRFTLERIPWREAQAAGLLFVPLRKPHENATDEHWRARGTFAEVEHPELGRTFTYAVSKWLSSECAWRRGPRAPRLGEHSAEVLDALDRHALRAEATRGTSDGGTHPGGDVAAQAMRRSRHDRPFALGGVRILDFTWWLASGGAPRFLSALGAENIKVEWKGNLDLRLGMAQAPVGGKAARARATGPLPPVMDSINMSGQFNDFHAGQRGISLNVRHPKGLEIARRLVAISDIVAEGFSPGVLESWGLGYAAMRAIKPDIIYVQQSGMGAQGVYGRFRTAGPHAASLAALSEMSGLPEPAPPAGWGYSYLDWFGAYNLALAMLAALAYRAATGKGQWIDASQVETGIFLGGTALLDWSANQRVWQRHGNRSPYKPAAPHGAYRCRGDDRWLAIACFDDEEWHALATVAGHREWLDDPRFATLAPRLENQDALDAEIGRWTATLDAHRAMELLQGARVAAGVCQTAEDRYERDPQLRALEWLSEVTGSEIGTWPVRELPVKMSETPPDMGGPTGRGAPCYGEDNEYVYGELLGLPTREIAELATDGVI